MEKPSEYSYGQLCTACIITCSLLFEPYLLFPPERLLVCSFLCNQMFFLPHAHTGIRAGWNEWRASQTATTSSQRQVRPSRDRTGIRSVSYPIPLFFLVVALLVFALNSIESFHCLSQHLLEILSMAENAKIFLGEFDASVARKTLVSNCECIVSLPQWVINWISSRTK